jgi:hypothetical protein
MPTAKPRIQVSLTIPQYELLRRLAKLQQRSMSAVVAELWESIHPVLERVAVVLQAAVRAQDSAREGLRAATELGEREMRPHVAAALGQLDLLAMDFEKATAVVPGRAQRDTVPPATPALVTRGSGTGGKHVHTPAKAIPRKVKSRKRRARR